MERVGQGMEKSRQRGGLYCDVAHESDRISGSHESNKLGFNVCLNFHLGKVQFEIILDDKIPNENKKILKSNIVFGPKFRVQFGPLAN